MPNLVFHESSASGDMYLICHVNSQDHLFEGLCEFTGGSCSLNATFPDKFGEHRHCDSGVSMSPAAHVTSKSQVIQGSWCNFISGSSSLYVTTLTSLVTISNLVEKSFQFVTLSSKTTWINSHLTLWTPKLSPSKNKVCFLLHWKPFKNYEKCFLFHLKSSFRSQDI